MTGSFGFIEPANRTSPLYRKFSGALSEFLESCDHSRFVAVLLCGSFARNTITSESDIDILLILPPGSTDREDFREVVYSGINIQLFSSTEADLIASFDWERKSSSRQRSSLVAHGVVVAGDKVVGDRIVFHGRDAWNATPPSLDLSDAKSMMNFIENQFPESMERLFKASTIGFLMTWNGMMDKYFHLVHQLEPKLLPRHNDMDADLSSIDDTELGRAFCAALSASELQEKKRLFFELSDLIRRRLDVFIEANR